MTLLDQALGQAKSIVGSKLGGALPSFEVLADRFLSKATLGTPFSSGQNAAPRSWWEGANRRSDPLLNVYWYCDLPEINGTRCPWNYVEEVALPFVEFEQISNYRAGKNVHYPSHYSVNALTAKLFEDSHGTASKYVNAWQSQILNRESGLYNVPSQYKKPVVVTVLNVAMATVLVFEYSGCWIQSSDAMTLASGSADAVSRNLTFSVDEVLVKFADFSARGQLDSLIDNVGKDFPASIPKLASSFPSVFNDIGSIVFR